MGACRLTTHASLQKTILSVVVFCAGFLVVCLGFVFIVFNICFYCCSVVCCCFVRSFVCFFCRGVTVSFRTDHLIKIIQDAHISYREERNRGRRKKPRANIKASHKEGIMKENSSPFFFPSVCGECAVPASAHGLCLLLTRCTLINLTQTNLTILAPH